MQIIEARTGKKIRVGETVTYPDGEWVCLVEMREGLFSAEGLIRYSDEGVVREIRFPMIVRYFHPDFMFQKTIFLVDAI